MGKGDGNKNAQARVNFLERAAQYLTIQSGKLGTTRLAEQDSEATAYASTSLEKPPANKAQQIVVTRQAQALNAQRRAVARKTQTRLSKDAKRSICRRCDATLIVGQTCEELVENRSRRRSKPWADVKVLKCMACETTKRFPVGMTRQPKKGNRNRHVEEASSKTEETRLKVTNKD